MPRRENYRGHNVLFPLGAVLLAAAAVALAVSFSPWLAFLCGVGALGLIDDLAAGSPRGLRAHGLATARGELSTGALKAVGTVGLAAYAAGAAGAEGLTYAAEVLVLALAAHVGNLLDSRPGRAEKALGLAALLVCAGSRSLEPLRPIASLLIPVAVCAWLTLRERAMLGDTGASMIGGMIGVLLVATLAPAALVVALAVLIAITAYGELRSISSAIERLPALRWIDRWGRLRVPRRSPAAASRTQG
jgi:UDP-GlcNAc:undecaprenyl-phosphate/decaprenyl-phosphate GlcNAc-1-phosphate transferase